MTETVDAPEIDEFELDLSSLVLDKTDLQMPSLAAIVAMAGNGKTHSALELTNVDGMWPVLVLDTEGSTVGVSQNFDPERYDVLKIENTKQFDQILDKLLTKSHKYKTVVVDTLDKAQERAGKKFERDNPGDGFAKYRELNTWLIEDEGVLPRLKRAPFFAVVIVHTREEKSTSGTIIQKVKLEGSAKNNFASEPDLVLYQTRRMTRDADTGKSELSTTVYTVPTKVFDQAKNRFDLPPVMKDATLATVFEAIKARIEERKNK